MVLKGASGRESCRLCMGGGGALHIQIISFAADRCCHKMLHAAQPAA